MLAKERLNNVGRPVSGSLLSLKLVRNVLAALGQCFDLAVTERPALLEVNPAKDIRLPKQDRRDMHFLEDAAACAALRSAMHEQFRPLLDFLVGTGARYGEAAGRPGDVGQGVTSQAAPADERRPRPVSPGSVGPGRRRREAPDGPTAQPHPGRRSPGRLALRRAGRRRS